MNNEIIQAWKDVAATPEGRKALADLYSYCCVYEERFPETEMQAGVLIGMRNVAAYIARAVGRTPEKYQTDATEDLNFMERMLQTRQGDY